MTTKQRNDKIEITQKMLDSNLDFISRFPNDPYVAKRQAEAAQMQRYLEQLKGGTR